jgi:glycosyltransferase involved in cell wall biosynthesis
MILILIPTYNRAKFLEECFQELKKQTCKDFEVVVYDDGSLDNTRDVVHKYGHTYLRGEKNHGVGYSRNKLFEYVKSLEIKPDFLMWQDSDDMPHPNRVQYMKLAIEEQGADIIFSDMYFFNHPQVFTRTRTLHRVDISKYKNRAGLERNMNFATAIFKPNLVEFPFQNKRKREDVAWLSDLIEAGVKFGYLPTGLYYCRRHDERLTKKL